MNIIVLEIQTGADGICAPLPPLVYGTEAEAESAYHNKLAYAAMSQVPIHAVAMFSPQGILIKRECYFHTLTPTTPAEEINTQG